MSSGFAGFTKAEWVQARALLVGDSEARAEIDDMFEMIARKGSNGFSIHAENFALLSLVSSACA